MTAEPSGYLTVRFNERYSPREPDVERQSKGAVFPPRDPPATSLMTRALTLGWGPCHPTGYPLINWGGGVFG